MFCKLLSKEKSWTDSDMREWLVEFTAGTSHHQPYNSPVSPPSPQSITPALLLPLVPSVSPLTPERQRSCDSLWLSVRAALKAWARITASFAGGSREDAKNDPNAKVNCLFFHIKAKSLWAALDLSSEM